MAVVNTKSTAITNADATPVVKNSGFNDGNKVRHKSAVVEIAAADDNASVYRMVRVHTSDCIHSLIKNNDALAGATDVDLGLYDTADNGGAVIVKDCYANGISLATAVTTGTDLTYSARNIDVSGQQVWQDAGLTSDPQKEVDICFTANTNSTVAGGLALDVQFSNMN